MKKVDLENIKDKPHPFQVPEGYFQNLERTILDATVDAPKEQPTIKTLWGTVPSWSWAVAASLVAAMTAALWFGGSSKSYEEGDLLAGISDEEIMIYLTNYDLNEHEIVGGLSPDQFDDLFMDETILDGLDLEEEDLDDMLLQYEALNETLEI